MTDPRGARPAADALPEGAAAGGEVSIAWFADALLRNRRTILTWTAVGFVLAVGIALVRGRTYTSSFSFRPQSEKMAPAGGLAGLAGQFGLNLAMLGAGSQEPPQLYADLLMTREVLSPIAADTVVAGDPPGRVAVAEFLKAKGSDSALLAENTMRRLRRDVISTTVATRTTGMVTVRVRTKSADASLAIAQRLLEGLNHFNLVTRQSQAREERRFTEQRLAEAQASLRKAEDALAAFLARNRAPEGSPTLLVERDRLERVVDLQQQVVGTLAEQFEENRIREVRDTPVLTVFEQPVRAARADPGLRVLIVVLGTGIGFLLGIIAVIGRDAWRGEWRRYRAQHPSAA
jgi:uncharacterized protein involved in exopolysaccharide biosynthesis